METQKTKLYIKLKTTDLKRADKLVKKMLSTLDHDDLDLIEECKLQVTAVEMEVNSNVFDEK